MDLKPDIPPPLGRRLIFKGRDIRVRSVMVRRGGPLVFTFAARRRGRPPKGGFGEKLFHTRGINAVHFINVKNHWWHTPEMLPAIAAATAMRAAAAPSRVLTYGYSMGGFGALAFANRLQADTVVALSPQASLFRADLPYDPTWPEDLGDTRELYRLTADCLTGCEVIVGYDPLFAIDIAHVAAVAALHPVTAIRMPLAGHRTPNYLREVGLLSQVVIGLVTGDDDWRRHRREIRATRTRSTVYLGTLLRRRPRTAPWVRPRLEALMLERIGVEGERIDQRTGERWLDQSCARLLLDGRSDEAIARARHFLDAFPESERAAYVLASLQITVGHYQDAQPILERLLLAQPQFVRLLLLKAMILLASGDVEAADALTLACLTHGTGATPDWRPAPPRDWRVAAGTLVGSALPATTQRAVLDQVAALLPHDRHVAALYQRLDRKEGGRGAWLAGMRRAITVWLRQRWPG